MITNRIKYALLLFIPLLVIACSLGSAETAEEPVAEASQAQDTAAEPTQVPTEVPTPAPTYPAQDICDEMAALVQQHLDLSVEIKADAFDDPSGLSGAGCTITASGTGEVITDWGQRNNNLIEAIKSQGWVEDFNFSGGGAGGILTTYRRQGYVIRYISEVRPEDMNLCSQDEPLPVCLDRINPAQRLYSVTISASPDSYESDQAVGPAQDVCDEMAALAGQHLSLPVEVKADTFDDPSGLSGAGCTVTASGTGEVVADWGQSNNNLMEAIRSQGWVEDFKFSAGGAGSLLTTYRRSGYVIRFHSESGPVDRNLCSQNEPFAVCMDRLPPAQRLYTVTINASPDSYASDQAAGPAKDACDQMAALAQQNLNLPADIKPDMFNETNGLSGPGCTVFASGTGEVVADWGGSSNNLYNAILAQGWVQDFQFSAGGAGGSLDVFRRNGFVCQYLSESGPVDMNLCTQNEPFASCMDRLTPAQRLYTVTISCSPDSYMP